MACGEPYNPISLVEIRHKDGCLMINALILWACWLKQIYLFMGRQIQNLNDTTVNF